MTLHRYWIEFDLAGYDRPPMGAAMGFGVTEHSVDVALALVQSVAFEGRPLPPTKRIREDLDIRTLDDRHIRPNTGNPVVRGIWFPLGYSRM